MSARRWRIASFSRSMQPGSGCHRRTSPADQLFLIVHGGAASCARAKYGDPLELALLADGDHFWNRAVVDADGLWDFSVKAVGVYGVCAASSCVSAGAGRFRSAAYASVSVSAQKPQDKDGQPRSIVRGTKGEYELPTTFGKLSVIREYELSVAQTILIPSARRGPVQRTDGSDQRTAD